jgi:hypothetical protein
MNLRIKLFLYFYIKNSFLKYDGEDVFILGMQFFQSGEIKTLGGFMVRKYI